MSSDRYLIYEMMNHEVQVAVSPKHGGGFYEGVVKEIFRNPSTDLIEAKIGDEKICFQEPDAITKDGDTISFHYGDVDGETDDDFFRENFNPYSESVDSYLRRTSVSPVTKTEFLVGERASPEKRCRRT